MEIQTENGQLPDTGHRPLSVGVTLREARERLGLNVADVANRLKFAPRQIEALEEDNYSRLPEIAFVRGFVRSYARLLQLDPEPLLAALPRPPATPEYPPSPPPLAVRFPGRAEMRKPNVIWVIAVLVVALALGLFLLLNDGEPGSPAQQAHQPSDASGTSVSGEDAVTDAQPKQDDTSTGKPVAQINPALIGPPAPPTLRPAPEAATVPPPPRQAAPIHMKFDQDAWVEVLDKNGIFLMAQLNLAGSERWVRGTPPFTLVIGNASNVHLFYQGKPIDLTPHNRAEVARLTLE